METSERLAYFRDDLNRALTDFEESLELLPDPGDSSKQADLIRNGIVQKFELVSELLWKTIRFFLLQNEGEDFRSPKKVIKGLLKYQYITEPLYEILFEIMDWRIKMTPIYRKELFEAAIIEVPNYLSSFQKVVTIINAYQQAASNNFETCKGI